MPCTNSILSGKGKRGLLCASEQTIGSRGVGCLHRHRRWSIEDLWDPYYWYYLRRIVKNYIHRRSRSRPGEFCGWLRASIHVCPVTRGRLRYTRYIRLQSYTVTIQYTEAIESSSGSIESNMSRFSTYSSMTNQRSDRDLCIVGF